MNQFDQVTVKLVVMLYSSSTVVDLEEDNRKVRGFIQGRSMADDQNFFKVLDGFDRPTLASILEPMLYGFIANPMSQGFTDQQNRMIEASSEKNWPQVQQAHERWKKIADEVRETMKASI